MCRDATFCRVKMTTGREDDPPLRTPCLKRLRSNFVQRREHVFNREAAELRESRLRDQLARLWFAHTRADSGPAVRERNRHTVERADRVHHLAGRPDVLLKVG